MNNLSKMMPIKCMERKHVNSQLNCQLPILCKANQFENLLLPWRIHLEDIFALIKLVNIIFSYSLRTYTGCSWTLDRYLRKILWDTHCYIWQWFLSFRKNNPDFSWQIIFLTIFFKGASSFLSMYTCSLIN